MDISVNHLSHAFQLAGSPLLVLNDLTCQFSATEVTAIVGASGSGKSTFLSMIGSLDRPTSGQIEYDGQDISRWKNRRLSAFRAQEIGFVFQQFHLLPALTVKENVLVPLLKQKTDFNKEERIAQILEKVGLLEKQHALPAQLSGGQQQRVAIARALISRPRWILADEPTGNLDSVTGETIFQLLLDLHREEQCGILFVTHDLALAERADRILFMQDGQIIEDRRKKTIQSG
ncbi:lipoprotein-releasing system ATP-binding protein LolD (plasmid) [Exiguobacterium sp. N4-1P]|uniref:ABC transporter ATP-binding protein n=1 Tax=unclassified Exiguobacterium TaxID=2644629 RepID=UPI000B590C18|nr:MULTISPECIES: ABC transporter ATP-binding protein [unclassified Exiguobacterium]ASI35394.1 lipoprotein-releasing system ATP-binding protein LolD [Exiguobacterium sp. N4-1P]ASI37407.1 lipoprotein-releasing system ATP-binding protein LolD [Exiguobacterium sp. N4-1P]